MHRGNVHALQLTRLAEEQIWGSIADILKKQQDDTRIDVVISTAWDSEEGGSRRKAKVKPMRIERKYFEVPLYIILRSEDNSGYKDLFDESTHHVTKVQINIDCSEERNLIGMQLEVLWQRGMAGPENRNALGKFLTEFEHIDRDLADLRLGGWHGTPFARYEIASTMKFKESSNKRPRQQTDPYSQSLFENFAITAIGLILGRFPWSASDDEDRLKIDAVWCKAVSPLLEQSFAWHNLLTNYENYYPSVRLALGPQVEVAPCLTFLVTQRLLEFVVGRNSAHARHSADNVCKSVTFLFFFVIQHSLDRVDKVTKRRSTSRSTAYATSVEERSAAENLGLPLLVVALAFACLVQRGRASLRFEGLDIGLNKASIALLGRMPGAVLAYVPPAVALLSDGHAKKLTDQLQDLVVLWCLQQKKMDNGCLDFEAKLAKVAQKSRVDFQKTLAAAVLARLEDEAKEAAMPGTRKKAKGKWRKYDDEGLSDLIRKTVSETPAAYTAAKQLLCEFPLHPLKSTEMSWARHSREADARALERAEAAEAADGADGRGAAQRQGKARSRDRSVGGAARRAPWRDLCSDRRRPRPGLVPPVGAPRARSCPQRASSGRRRLGGPLDLPPS
mmetsp:Transcript_29811/g.104896  ORF Transcript_29811/g.104896 Transcript_29811/m.104896 type:complete len:618 (+) Transcript_29811:1938-3791(+)